MIQKETLLKVVDNSGVKKVKCIKTFKGTIKKTGIGELITVSVCKLKNNYKDKINKGDIFKAVIIRQKKKYTKKTDFLHIFKIMLLY